MTSTMRFDKWENSLGQPYGTVLQVVVGTYAVNTSTTSTTYQNTGLTATITPKSSTSKILIIATHHTYKGLQNSGNGVMIRILRNATQIVESGNMLYTGSATDLTGMSALQVYDSPATTNPVVYSTQFKNVVAATQVMINYGNSPSQLTLMEIAQ